MSLSLNWEEYPDGLSGYLWNRDTDQEENDPETVV
jgi:hypothetical protein